MSAPQLWGLECWAAPSGSRTGHQFVNQFANSERNRARRFSGTCTVGCQSGCRRTEPACPSQPPRVRKKTLSQPGIGHGRFFRLVVEGRADVRSVVVGVAVRCGCPWSTGTCGYAGALATLGTQITSWGGVPNARSLSSGSAATHAARYASSLSWRQPKPMSSRSGPVPFQPVWRAAAAS